MDWTQIIITLISLVLVPMLMWGLAELSKMLAAKTVAIQDSDVRQAAVHLLAIAQSNIQTAVMETAQTYVDGIKGKPGWDAAAQGAALAQAKARFEGLMGAAGLEALSDIVGDIGAWAESHIEAAVKTAKAA